MGKEAKAKKVSDYKPDPLNHNAGSEYGNSLLEKSIQKNGLGRGIVVSNDGVIIAGNKTHAKAGELGLDKVIEVETDGNTLVVVRRTDIKSGTKEFYNNAIADNLVGQHNYVENAEVLEAIAENYEVEPYEWGVQDTTQLHPEKGQGLKHYNLGEEDDGESGDRIDNTPKDDNTMPVVGMLNKAYKTKWEKIKQAAGVKKDTDMLVKFIDKAGDIEW